MNIRDLQYLVAVYDLGSFSKAADKCFVSQPTLSGQLKKMEEQLGAALIERSTRQVLFTPLGKQVVEKARQVLMSVEHIKILAERANDPLCGDLNIGLIPTVGPFLLPLIMGEISDKFPKMNVFLHELQTEQLIEKLLQGQLDAGILAKLDWDYPVREFDLYEETLQLAMPDNDPLVKQGKKLDWSVLDGRSVLTLVDGHCLRDQTLGVCFSAGADEDQRFQATSLDTLLHMVAAKAGITLIPELACQPRAGVVYRQFSASQPSRKIILITRKNSPRITALEALSELMIDIMQS